MLHLFVQHHPSDVLMELMQSNGESANGGR
jgi:hypothetical protein